MGLKVKLLLAGTGIVLVAMGAWWFANLNQRLGGMKASAEMLEQMSGQWEQERKTWVDRLSASDAHRTELTALVNRTNVALAEQSRRMQVMQQQRTAAREQVDTLTDSETFLDLRRKLGVVPESSVTVHLQPVELRAANRIVNDYPFVLSQLEESKKTASLLEEKVQVSEDLVKTEHDKFLATADYANQLEGHYKTAFDVAQRSRKRHWFLRAFCLFRCGNPKLNLPEPAVVVASRPEG